MDIAKVRLIIEKQLAELNEQQETLGDSAAVVVLDQSRVGRLSRMDALQTQAMQVETLRRIKSQIAGLSRALARIEQHDFGYCQDCEEEISAARLELNPAVRKCIRCAEIAEAH